MRILKTLLSVVLGLGVLASAAHAEEAYPAKPVRVVVPLAAGGPTDYLARTLAQSLSTSLGQPVVVENKPGADGAIAAREVINAPADGYTVLFAPGSLVAVPLLSNPPSFDWLAEFAPVGKVGRLSFCLMVNPELPVRNVAELVAYARANPDKLNYATSTMAELMAAAKFMKASGIRMTRVAYKGGAQAMPDLLAGRIQVMFGPASFAVQHVSSGGLRVLATLLPQRSAVLPEVPTLAEAGYAGVTVPTWQSVFVRAGTPAAVVERLAGGIDTMLARPEVRAEFERRLVFVEQAMPQELGATVKQDQAAWSALIAEYKLGTE